MQHYTADRTLPSTSHGTPAGAVIRARAPLRISFGGGGTDVPPYCDDEGGAILSATINRYAYATLRPTPGRLGVESLDYDAAVSYSIDDPFILDGQLDLAQGVLDHFRRHAGLPAEKGMTIALHNDAPPGSGLGSSSAITVAMIGAIAEHLRLPLDPYSVAELAYRVEREEVGIKGGKQDQYNAAFGGFSFMEFKDGATVVNSLRLRPETVFELEYSLVFAFVGGQHFSSHIIERQVENYREGRGRSVRALHRIKELAHEMKRALLLGRLRDFGDLLHESWEHKKALADGITNPALDAVYDRARAAGALGGKVSGAGGGGFMFFLCDAGRRFAVQDAVRAAGGQLVNFSFVEEGLRTWTIA